MINPFQGLKRQQELPLAMPPSIPSKRGDYKFLEPAKPTVVFDTYWRFAAERQQVYYRRLAAFPRPWSADPVLQGHKFTNAYRASDRVSQYLIRKVIYQGDHSFQEVFFRTLLFKFFNRIETWERLLQAFGSVTITEFQRERFERVFDDAQAKGERLYSAAYIMPSGGRASDFRRKHQMHLWLLERMLKEDLHERILSARSMAEAFALLRSYPTIGDFLAYQYITDLNYSSFLNFSEMEFVVPGPGARSGLQKCFSDYGGLSEPEIIRLVAERQEDCMRAAGITFCDLWGRKLQLIDCQNLFCEVDKYARVVHPNMTGHSGRTRIKQKFRPLDTVPRPWFPPKWTLNDRITDKSIHVYASSG